jgi:hypothetical protein
MEKDDVHRYEQIAERLKQLVSLEQSVPGNKGEYSHMLDMVLETGVFPTVNVMTAVAADLPLDVLYRYEVGPCKTLNPTRPTAWDRGILNFMKTWVFKNVKLLFWNMHAPADSKKVCNDMLPAQIAGKERMYASLLKLFMTTKGVSDAATRPFMTQMRVFGSATSTIGYVQITVRINEKTDTLSVVDLNPKIVGLMRISDFTDLPTSFVRAVLYYDPTQHIILVVRNVINTDTAIFLMHKNLATN